MRSFLPSSFASRPALLSASLALAFAFAGCDGSPRAPRTSSRNSELSSEGPQFSRNASPSDDLRRRQLAFLERIRKSDVQGRTIDRALLNEKNELGLILDRSVQMDQIPALMRTMLGQMAREFPGQDLVVIAYAPSNPPRRIGVGRLNARTREMTYTPDR